MSIGIIVVLIFVFLLPFLFFFSWIYAVIKCTAITQILLGTLTFVTIGVTSFFGAYSIVKITALPLQERFLYPVILQYSRDLIEKGDSEKVAEAYSHFLQNQRLSSEPELLVELANNLRGKLSTDDGTDAVNKKD